jgi:SAM-dependent methyltransferase
VKGFVPTPKETVDRMVDRLFFERRPKAENLILDPGCGEGEFIQGILRWCASHRASIPRIVGIESDLRHVKTARGRFAGCPSVEIRHADFLKDDDLDKYDFVIGNPPYVPITGLNENEKERYRARYETAAGRFDLYLLFFEQALALLKNRGRLVFITPEKFLYVETARPLRKILAQKNVEEIRMISEETFGDLVTYPTITSVVNDAPSSSVLAILRNGSEVKIALGCEGFSWLPGIMGTTPGKDGPVLEDICVRISCGVATGADGVFVKRLGDIDSSLRRFAYPTIAGRELGESNGELHFRQLMLVPYDLDGNLIPEGKLGSLGDYLSQRPVRTILNRRTCVQRKPWYAFHETPPLIDILRPKILCKDIAERPRFWIDRGGKLIPRHSAYYLVPNDPTQIEELCDFLNSDGVAKWLEGHCQRAANGFLRLQSQILKKLPLPFEFGGRSKISRKRCAAQPIGRTQKGDSRTSEFEFGR